MLPRGLKYDSSEYFTHLGPVEAYVASWIEMYVSASSKITTNVEAYVASWIEIF